MTNLPSIPTTKLGSNGPTVGVQGLGCMGMSEFYGPTDHAESLATLEHALDRGVTLIDTADMYGLGHNEELIGPVVRRRRKDVLLATKFGFVRRADDPMSFGIDNRPAHIRAAVEGSLRRLGVDVIDLYYMHRRTPEVPLADSVGAMADLVKAGKVRYLGLSEVSADELREAHAIHPITALQSEWSLFARDLEAAVVPAAAALGIAIVAFSPLGRGMLTGVDTTGGVGEAGDIRSFMPRFTGENGENNARLVARVRALAAARGVTAAQLALAWVHGRARVHAVTVVPIPGTRKRSRLDENLAAATLELTPAELEALEPLAAAVLGHRGA
ncbi:aldo/keto reductase [Polyangium aurulentum]|uniref:aldo/keto reductase n=1 Tax=Polyangium aurulentum TaxID=2567896 RepID=UPI0019806EAA|nr:aldo/keto reductase [Polyangium aurulentum]UQA60924.1 aldo/keto reductase [Polyangium aurulentum]